MTLQLEHHSNHLKMSTNVTGDEKYSGTAFFTSLSLSAPNNDKATWTGTLQGSGALTIGTVA